MDVIAMQHALEARRRSEGITGRPTTAAALEARAWLSQTTTAAVKTLETRPPDPDPAAVAAATWPGAATVKVYPTLAAAFTQTGRAAEGRLWLLIHAIDGKRRGMIEAGRVYRTLAGEPDGRAWRIGTRRRLQQVIAAGAGIFWRRDEQDRLWVKGPAHVARALDVHHLTGRPVTVAVADLWGGAHSYKAVFFAAAGTLRRRTVKGKMKARPVTRRTLRQMTGAAESTQRTYDKTAGTRARPNRAIISNAVDSEALQAAHWTHGRGVFVFLDHTGRQGGGRRRPYLARAMGNSYDVPLAAACNGRQRKVNRRLNLVSAGRGAMGRAVDYSRLYHDTANEAAAAYGRRPHDDHYWRRCRTADGGAVWHMLGAV